MLSRTSDARILVVDDARAIHEDFRRILARDEGRNTELEALEADLFGAESATEGGTSYTLDSAYQGQEALAKVEAARSAGAPYSLAFVDMRMPPGWDGLETIRRIWQVDDRIEIVICTAYSDRSWQDIHDTLGDSDKLLIIKKPFDVLEVKQAARALVTKWALQREVEDRLQDLEGMVRRRTADLECLNEELRKQIADRERMEIELRHAQKLEAVGLLAAGIAHEINTPIQFVGDSTQFLRGGFDDLLRLLDAYGQAVGATGDEERAQLEATLKPAEEAADLEYLREEIPEAFERTLDGVRRVADIVKAMKQFGHPDGRTKDHANLNEALQNTLVVARHEYKYVATVETELGCIPLVPCHIGDMNQVFLNLIVNAAHAVADAVADSGGLGVIRVRTRDEGDDVVVSVEDSGRGIPEEIRTRIFDPFFTTKAVGKGTGQGLAIARSIVVDKHGGSLWFETAEGRGTAFHVRLPKQATFPASESVVRAAS